MKKSQNCDVCGIGELTPTVDRYLSSYKGKSESLFRHSHLCSHCGGDYASESDAKKNKREVLRFHKTVDAIPLGCEIRAMREAAGLTQLEAGLIFGGGPTAFSKYESDDLIPNDSMVNLLKLAMHDLGIVARLRLIKGVHVTFGAFGEISDHPSGYDSDSRAWESLGVSPTATKTSEIVVVSAGPFGVEQTWTQ